MKGELSKLKGGENVRTREVVGEFAELPCVGKRFVIANTEPLQKKNGENARAVITSLVKKVDYARANEKIIVFDTENSTYQLLLMEELKDADTYINLGE